MIRGVVAYTDVITWFFIRGVVVHIAQHLHIDS